LSLRARTAGSNLGLDCFGSRPASGRSPLSAGSRPEAGDPAKGGGKDGVFKIGPTQTTLFVFASALREAIQAYS